MQIKTTLIVLFLISPLQLIAQDQNLIWTLVKNDQANDIKIYYRTLKSGNIEFKGITYITSTLNSLIALFNDVDEMPNWVYRTEKVLILKEIGKNEVFVHTINTMPFPFKKRDAIIHSFIHQDPNNYTITIKGNSKPSYIPFVKEYVRIQKVESTWKFIPIEKSKIEVVFQGYGEPGGNIPSSIYRSPIFRWLCKLFLWQLPYTTLKNMKTAIKNNKYKLVKFSYIQEPIRQKIE